MSYRIRIDSFEGPFDLLLYLVSRQKVDIGSISITEIVDQYIGYIDRMRELDLDVASDFLLVASTLLDIKAASLIPQEKSDVEDELEDLSPGRKAHRLQAIQKRCGGIRQPIRAGGSHASAPLRA